jgi:hypothetical protein
MNLTDCELTTLVILAFDRRISLRRKTAKDRYFGGAKYDASKQRYDGDIYVT